MRTPLFNFIALRNPETISNEGKERYFINITAAILPLTHYYQDIGSQTFFDLKREIRRRAVNFNNAATLNELKSEHSALYQFYREIRSERFRNFYNDIHEVVETLRPGVLSLQQEARLWDNFVHYLWVDPQEYEIEVITAILVANKFLSTYQEFPRFENQLSESEQKTLRRITRAKVVIPLVVNNRVQEAEYARLSRRQRKMLEAAHDQFVNRVELQQFEELQSQIARLHTTVTTELDEQTRAENVAKEARLRETLASLDFAVSLEDVKPIVSRKPAPPRPPVRKEQIRSRLTPAALVAFERIKDESEDLSRTTSKLTAQIQQMQLDTVDQIETSSSVSFRFLGNRITSEERIPASSMIVKAKLVGIETFDYYLTYYDQDRLNQLISVTGDITVNDTVRPVQATKQAEQQPGFQTFELNSAPITGLLATFNLTIVQAKNPAQPNSLPAFQVFELIPHFDVPSLGEIDDFTAQPPPLFGVNKLGIADFRRVEQEVSCYIPGEVSHIENIMASEYKERVSRSLTVFETEEEITDEFTSERQSDTEIAEKLEMQSQVSTVLNEEKSRSFNAGAGVSVNFPGGTFTANAGFNFNSASSREESNSQALEVAKSITNRIQEKIIQKQTATRRSKSRREFEDTNKHGYDNRQGSEHVVGIYRWVDKIYTNYLVNYGRRLMYEWTVPAPAENFIRAQTPKAEASDHGLMEPKAPKDAGLLGPSSLNRSNYLSHAARYSANVSAPPEATMMMGRSFSSSVSFESEDEEAAQPTSPTEAFNEIEIPDGYYAENAILQRRVVWDQEVLDALYEGDIEKLRKLGAFFSCLIGGYQIEFAEGGIGGIYLGEAIEFSLFLDQKPLYGNVPIGIATHLVKGYVFNVTIKCQLSDIAFRAWQLETYNQIFAAYRDRLAEYEAAIAEYEAGAEKINLNPRFKQDLMETELKRLCIEMITRPFNVDVSKSHYEPAVDDKQPLRIRFSATLDQHAMRVKFLEQAFDWHLMAYIFYPYFYAAEETWLDKVSQENTSNQLFESFLKSGMARMVIPVNQGFEQAVMYYLQTGEVWFGNDFVLDVKNDLHLSVADELNTANEEFMIEETWQTKIPTNLTILQARSAALDQEGLPCNITDNQIGTGNSVLNPIIPVPASQG